MANETWSDEDGATAQRTTAVWFPLKDGGSEMRAQSGDGQVSLY